MEIKLYSITILFLLPFINGCKESSQLTEQSLAWMKYSPSTLKQTVVTKKFHTILPSEMDSCLKQLEKIPFFSVTVDEAKKLTGDDIEPGNLYVIRIVANSKLPTFREAPHEKAFIATWTGHHSKLSSLKRSAIVIDSSIEIERLYIEYGVYD